jgi:hypothetical protein
MKSPDFPKKSKVDNLKKRELGYLVLCVHFPAVLSPLIHSVKASPLYICTRDFSYKSHVARVSPYLRTGEKSRNLSSSSIDHISKMFLEK